MVNSNYEILIDFGEGYETCPGVLFSDFEKEELLYKDLKPTDSKVSVSITPNIPFINKLNEVKDTPKVRINKNGEIYFTGYLRINYDLIKNNKLQPVKADIVAESFLLKRKIGKDISLFDMPYVCNNDNPTHSVVHVLLATAGVTDFILPNLSATVPSFMVTSGDSTYYDLLTAMFFEYNYVFLFDISGTLIVKELFHSTLPEITQTFNGSNILDEVKKSRAEKQYERVIVEWQAVTNYTNTLLFSHTSAITVAPNSWMYGQRYWETDKFSTSLGDVIGTGNLSLQVKFERPDSLQTPKVELVGYSFKPFSAIISIFNYNGFVPMRVNSISVYGDAYIITGISISEIVHVIDTDKILKFTTKYTYDKPTGDALANNLDNYYQNLSFNYTLKSSTNYDLGSYCSVSEYGIGTQTCRIIGKKIAEQTDVISYTLESVAENIPAEVTGNGRQVPVIVTPTILNDSIASIPALNIDVDTVNSITYGLTTQVPTVPTVTIVPALKAFILTWDKQSNLSNLKYYRVQVSEDGSTWYDLKLDRTDYKGTLYGATEWTGESIVHTLPSKVDENGNAIPWTLYYHVQRYTKLDVPSEWSIVVSATSLLVDTGDIAANSITANQISTDTLNAMIANVSDKLQVGDVGYIGQSFITSEGQQAGDTYSSYGADGLSIYRWTNTGTKAYSPSGVSTTLGTGSAWLDGQGKSLHIAFTYPYIYQLRKTNANIYIDRWHFAPSLTWEIDYTFNAGAFSNNNAYLFAWGSNLVIFSDDTNGTKITVYMQSSSGITQLATTTITTASGGINSFPYSYVQVDNNQFAFLTYINNTLSFIGLYLSGSTLTFNSATATGNPYSGVLISPSNVAWWTNSSEYYVVNYSNGVPVIKVNYTSFSTICAYAVSPTANTLLTFGQSGSNVYYSVITYNGSNSLTLTKASTGIACPIPAINTSYGYYYQLTGDPNYYITYGSNSDFTKQYIFSFSFSGNNLTYNNSVYIDLTTINPQPNSFSAFIPFGYQGVVSLQVIEAGAYRQYFVPYGYVFQWNRISQLSSTNLLVNGSSVSVTSSIYPIGFVYTQYPGELSPIDFGWVGTWHYYGDGILPPWGGAFFRAEGGNANSFVLQNNTVATGTTLTALKLGTTATYTAGSIVVCPSIGQTGKIVSGSGASYVISGFTIIPTGTIYVSQGQDLMPHTHSFSGAPGGSGDSGGQGYVGYGNTTGSTGTTETRPFNFTKRIWKRTS